MHNHPLVDTVFTTIKPFIGNAPHHFLLACSGGADSTALLLAFYRIKAFFPCTVSVVSVNHNIRSAAESAADADFVAKLCQRLELSCFIEELPCGAVSDCAALRGRGIEDAARTLRYRVFEKIADTIKADFIVTAHNKNDSYETALMRLFQGGGTAGLRTMPILRGRYLRPLITVDRNAIETFLHHLNTRWCEDSTNAETTYLRNRIRRFLIPALTDTFGSWHSGFDKTLQRIALDCSFCTRALNTARQTFKNGTNWQHCKHGALKLSSEFFFSLHPALRLRVIEEGCLLLNINERIPFGILLRMIQDAPQTNIIAAGNLRMEVRHTRIFLFKNDEYHTLYGKKDYEIWVDHAGFYPYPLGQLEISECNSLCFIKDASESGTGIGPFHFPLCIRSKRSGDRIRMNTGGFKEIKKILNEWSIDSLARELLPIIIENNYIRALYGSPLGYKNRFVEEQQ